MGQAIDVVWPERGILRLALSRGRRRQHALKPTIGDSCCLNAVEEHGDAVTPPDKVQIELHKGDQRAGAQGSGDHAPPSEPDDDQHAGGDQDGVEGLQAETQSGFGEIGLAERFRQGIHTLHGLLAHT